MTHAQALSIAVMLMWAGCACLILGLAVGRPGASAGDNSGMVGKEGA